MKIRNSILIIMFCAFFGFQAAFAAEMSVGRSHGKKSISISSSKDFAVYEIGSDRGFVFRKNREYPCSAAGRPGSVKVGDRVFNNGARIVKMRGGITVDGLYLRGNVELRHDENGELIVYEKIDIELYLLGVLRAEMGAGWPIEAYKAQAVIARTYAMKNANAHKFGICSGVHCQVYRPAENIDPVILEAVVSTRGQVVKYKGEIANTFFHACCGGSTANVKDVWGGEHDYLVKSVCSYCRPAPHYSWSRSITSARITSALVRMGHNVSGQTLRNVYTSEIDYSGRAKMLNFNYSGRRVSVKASSFRLSVGPELLRSTKIRRITKQKDGFLFAGNGWGHGVGLCQWGARGMAEAGYGYRAIIKKYYRGTKIEQI